MSRFSQMLIEEMKAREVSESVVATEFGWTKQAFNTWKNGVMPRKQWFGPLSRFLHISIDDVESITNEARVGIASGLVGRVTDRKDGRFHFDGIPSDRYAFSVDTKIMEPALVLGAKAWAQPGVWPQIGNEVIAHARGGSAWIGRLSGMENGAAILNRHAAPEITVRDVQAVHVIVLSERLAGGGVSYGAKEK
jgi:hypothetical protein